MSFIAFHARVIGSGFKLGSISFQMLHQPESGPLGAAWDEADVSVSGRHLHLEQHRSFSSQLLNSALQMEKFCCALFSTSKCVAGKLTNRPQICLFVCLSVCLSVGILGRIFFVRILDLGVLYFFLSITMWRTLSANKPLSRVQESSIYRAFSSLHRRTVVSRSLQSL